MSGCLGIDARGGLFRNVNPAYEAVDIEAQEAHGGFGSGGLRPFSPTQERSPVGSPGL